MTNKFFTLKEHNWWNILSDSTFCPACNTRLKITHSHIINLKLLNFAFKCPRCGHIMDFDHATILQKQHERGEIDHECFQGMIATFGQKKFINRAKKFIKENEND